MADPTLEEVRERRTAAAQELADLQNARGAALADGASFDDRKIARATAEIGRLNDLESELVRRAREADDQAAGERRERTLASIARVGAERTTALVAAEAACREMVSAMTDSLLAGADLQALYGQLGEHGPPALSGGPAMRVLSEKLSAVLKIVSGHASWFGRLRLASSYFKSNQPWTQEGRSPAAPRPGPARKLEPYQPEGTP